MYQIKNKIYADAGYKLKHENKIAFNFENVDLKDVVEIPITFDNMRVEGNFIIYGTNRDYISCIEYGDWKKKLINKQFTNDDQIAIILNKDDSDDDLMLFNKMQEWREWSGVLAKKIVSVISNN